MTAGALELAAAYRYFPAGTIFVAVVDPGVGSARRGFAADTGDYRFVAPDNGVLTQVLRETPAKKMVELTERRYARPTVSRTFEGRDRFAPAAAWLAKGIQLSALGRPISDIQRLDIPRARGGRRAGARRRRSASTGSATSSPTSIARRSSGSGRASAIAIDAGGHRIERLVATYAELPADGVGALFGSTDHLELAAPSVSAADRLGLTRGAAVTVDPESLSRPSIQ